MTDIMFNLKIHPMLICQCKSLSWVVELPIFVILERVSIQDDQQDDQKYAQVEDWPKLNGVLILLPVSILNDRVMVATLWFWTMAPLQNGEQHDSD